MSTPLLAAHELTLGFDGAPVISDLDVHVPGGEVTTIIGPNGCGKSTLLKGLSRLLKPRSGQVLLGGEDIARIPQKKLAQRMAVLAQNPLAPAGLSVQELVARGRSPQQKWYQQFSLGDEKAVHLALAATGITDLAHLPLDQLSGGQRQRAWISMTLAQESEIVLLDEPTTFLDLAHQVEVLELVRRLNRDLGKTVIMVLHDISLAAKYSDRLIAMASGSIVAQGSPEEVVTPGLLWEIFGLNAQVISEPVDHRPHVIPLGSSDISQGGSKEEPAPSGFTAALPTTSA